MIHKGSKFVRESVDEILALGNAAEERHNTGWQATFYAGGAALRSRRYSEASTYFLTYLTAGDPSLKDDAFFGFLKGQAGLLVCDSNCSFECFFATSQKLGQECGIDQVTARRGLSRFWFWAWRRILGHELQLQWLMLRSETGGKMCRFGSRACYGHACDYCCVQVQNKCVGQQNYHKEPFSCGYWLQKNDSCICQVVWHNR